MSTKAPSLPTIQAALATISKWKDHRGLTPFANAGSPHAQDRCSATLASASAIVSMLAAPCTDSQALIDAGTNSMFDGYNKSVLAGALEGVETLIDLGSLLMEGE